jgi:hypothetical protein
VDDDSAPAGAGGAVWAAATLASSKPPPATPSASANGADETDKLPSTPRAILAPSQLRDA